MLLVTFPSPIWIEELKASYHQDVALQKVFTRVRVFQSLKAYIT